MRPRRDFAEPHFIALHEQFHTEHAPAAQIVGDRAGDQPRAFPRDGFTYPELDPGGLYQWRTRGERHTFNPDTVSKLQIAVKRDSYEDYKEFSKAADGDAEHACTLRGLFRFRPDRPGVPLEEVEPVEAIVKRFCTGAMSYGLLSLEAHQTLAIAMNRLGGRSNTGEGGEDPDRPSGKEK